MYLKYLSFKGGIYKMTINRSYQFNKPNIRHEFVGFFYSKYSLS